MAHGHRRRTRVSLRKQAQREARREIQPNLDALTADQQHYDEEQARRQDSSRSFAQALAQIMGKAAPQTQDAYHQAAGADAAFAKGFSGALSGIAGQENSSLSDTLAKAGISGAPAADALGHIGDFSNLLYGTSGFLPGSALEREGAAFTAAASMQPQTALGMGEANVRQLQLDQKDQDFKYAQELAQQRGQIPQLARQILSDMLNQRQQEESLAIQQGYLGNANRAAEINATGVDPVTGSPKPGYYVTKGGRVVPDGYVVRNGRVVRDPSASGAKSGPLAEFDKSIAQANDNIYSSAQDLVKTIKNTGPLAGLPGHPASHTHAPAFGIAAKQLFNEYKYLLRGVPRKAQPRAKRMLVATIRHALIAAGIKPGRRRGPQPSRANRPRQQP